MVSGLYGANFAGRLLASRLARRTKTQHLLLASIGIGLAGLPLLLGASHAALAAAGIAVTGAGIGATFPLTCSLHVATSSRRADSALGQVFATPRPGRCLAHYLSQPSPRTPAYTPAYSPSRPSVSWPPPP
jgi:predicted MFS family arabinose efflux permease